MLIPKFINEYRYHIIKFNLFCQKMDDLIIIGSGPGGYVSAI